MKQIYKDRLLKLANHLEKGKLFHKIFDFNVFNVDERELLLTDKCGTSGCAIGECPLLFPKAKLKWKSLYSWAKFFGLDEDRFEALFIPEKQKNTILKFLFYTASKEEVAKNIREFVKANGEIYD